MADQIAIQLPKTLFDQGSAFTAKVFFRDRATSAASTPSLVEFKLYNTTVDKVIRNWTQVTPASSVEIDIGSSWNEIQSDANSREKINLIIIADRGMSTEVRDSRHYVIKNIEGLPKRSTLEDATGALYSGVIASVDALDLIHVIDVSDTTAGPDGTPKLASVSAVVVNAFGPLPSDTVLYDADSNDRLIAYRRNVGRYVATSTTVSQDDDDSFIQYNGAGGDNLTLLDPGAAGTTVTVKNAGSGVLNILEDTGNTLSWFNGSSILTGDRTLAVGGVMTLLYDSASYPGSLTTSLVDCWGLGVS